MCMQIPDGAVFELQQLAAPAAEAPASAPTSGLEDLYSPLLAPSAGAALGSVSQALGRRRLHQVRS